MKGFLTVLMLAGMVAAYYVLPAQPRPEASQAPKQHRFTDPGIAFTTVYVALRVPTGVLGIAPGTRLIECLDQHVPDKEVVSNGTYTFAIEPQLLTHDMDLASQLAADDQQGQVHAASSRARDQAQRVASEHSANLLTARDVDQVNAASVASSTVGNYDSALRQSPATVAGTSGSYYSGYGTAGGDVRCGGTNIVNVTINQNGGAGAGGSGGAGNGSAQRVSKYVAPQPTPVRGVTNAMTGTMRAARTGVAGVAGVGFGAQ